MAEEVLELTVSDKAALEYAISFYRPGYTITERRDNGVVLRRNNRLGLPNLLLIVAFMTQTPTDIGLLSGAAGADKLKAVDKKVREIRIKVAKSGVAERKGADA